LKTQSIQSRIVFPHHLNDHHTLFGGIAMQWMDEAAYITASRYTEKKVVTVSVKEVNFISPLRSGMIADIHSKIISAGNVKLEILIEIYAEDVYSGTSQKAAYGVFTMAAVNDDMKAVRLKSE